MGSDNDVLHVYNWTDMLAIPSDAPYPENACALLDYLMEPEAIREGPSICPTAEVFRRLSIDRAWSQEQMRAISRAWARIKAGE